MKGFDDKRLYFILQRFYLLTLQKLDLTSVNDGRVIEIYPLKLIVQSYFTINMFQSNSVK